MLIIIPELDPEQVENTLSRARTVIDRTGGEITRSKEWGRRKLAYEIENRSEGFYYVMEFTTGERTLTELKRILRVSDDVLRHIVVKLPEEFLDSRAAAEEAVEEGVVEEAEPVSSEQ